MEGFLDATSGCIQIEGHSVHSGMEGIAGLVGICPQHDLLWESLTGREHLLFYARLHAFTVSTDLSSNWPVVHCALMALQSSLWVTFCALVHLFLGLPLISTGQADCM